MRHFLSVISLFILTACADQILTTEESRVIGSTAATDLSVAPISHQNTLLGSAAARADQLASAYYTAGLRATRAQQAINTGVYLAAGSVAIGALGSASDRTLTNRAFAGVGLQTIGQNGVPKTTVQSLFKGATQLNCIAGIAAVYSGGGSTIANSQIAQKLTFSAMQNVRIAARNNFVGDIQSFSAALKSFTDVVQSSDGTEAVLAPDVSKVSDLEKFLGKLGSCIS